MDVSCVESVAIRDPIFEIANKHEAFESKVLTTGLARGSDVRVPPVNTKGLPRHPKSTNQTLLLFRKM